MRARARARANGIPCGVETEWKQLLKEQAFKPLGKWKGFSWLRKVSRAHSCALGCALGARSGRARLRARVRARARACAKGIPRWVELEWKEPLKEQTFKPVSKWKGLSRQGKVSPARSCALGLRIQDEVLARGLLQMIHDAGRKLKKPRRKSTNSSRSVGLPGAPLNNPWTFGKTNKQSWTFEELRNHSDYFRNSLIYFRNSPVLGIFLAILGRNSPGNFRNSPRNFRNSPGNFRNSPSKSTEPPNKEA